ncbi:MAG TPA: DUF5808 domain-containing protein [Ktedonobacterales bacterium]|nr:DUF5808 domain-containing protein [Ktedonobacterales bacterium]
MNAFHIVLLLIGVVLLAVTLVLQLWTRRSRAAYAPPPAYQLFGRGVREDERYWLAGGFCYSNPDDPALFVLNRWGIGITPNLAHPLAVRVAIGLLVVLALIPFVLTLLFPGLGGSGNGCHALSGCHLTP